MGGQMQAALESVGINMFTQNSQTTCSHDAWSQHSEGARQTFQRRVVELPQLSQPGGPIPATRRAAPSGREPRTRLVLRDGPRHHVFRDLQERLRRFALPARLLVL